MKLIKILSPLWHKPQPADSEKNFTANFNTVKAVLVYMIHAESFIAIYFFKSWLQNITNPLLALKDQLFGQNLHMATHQQHPIYSKVMRNILHCVLAVFSVLFTYTDVYPGLCVYRHSRFIFSGVKSRLKWKFKCLRVVCLCRKVQGLG